MPVCRNFVLAAALTSIDAAVLRCSAGRVNLVVSNPSPSLAPVSLAFSQAAAGQLQVSWPSDHIGWQLEIQTNISSVGLGTNWVIVPGANNTNNFVLPMDPAVGNVFLRLVYP